MKLNFFKLIRICVYALSVLMVFQIGTATAATVKGLAVLLPDDVVSSDPRVMAWVDAADEEGLQLELITDSQFLQMGSAAQQYKGIILPDQIHQRASDVLVQAVKDYVTAGGRVMLVYDAGALTDSGFYPPVKSRFSDLVGVDYVMYDELRDQTIGLGPVVGIEKTLWDLQVPPGKSMPFPGGVSEQPQYLQSSVTNPGGVSNYSHRLHHEYRKESKDIEQADQRSLGVVRRSGVYHSYTWPSSTYKKSKEDGGSNYYYKDSDDREWDKNYEYKPAYPQPIMPATSAYGITGYVYGFLDYPSFVTRGTYSGTTLLSSMDFGLVAGVNAAGNGQVLFVNVPLSYLEGQTDGMLLHGFLRYFGATLLKMPRLASQPKGRGGMVLNWHVDDGSAIQALGTLYTQGIWDRGPYSIHFTAGPDVDAPGDGLGMDLKSNSLAQNWVRYFVGKKHQVGSHGGWIHNYFGLNANESNQTQFLPLIVMNKQAIEYVTQRPLTEYSAPQGNNPSWALNWLEQNGILGYYYAGHTGMGPTRAYKDGKMINPGMWAFPVSTLGEYATFEEFATYGVSDADITRWLSALVDFAVHNRTSRLIYFHPPGAVSHPDVMKALMDRTDAYKAYDEFKWYTMTDMARFLNSRRQVSWQVVDGYFGRKVFVAKHPVSLSKQAWLLPKDAYSKPYVFKGDAEIEEGDENWVVIAKSCTELQFSTMPLN